MSDNQMSLQTILVGAVIGGMLGGTAASVFTSKNASSVRDNFHEYSDKIQAFIHSVNDNVSSSIHDNAESLTDRAHDILSTMKSEFDSFPDLENKDFQKGLMVGAALGSLVGAGGAALYNSCSPKADKCNTWSKVAKEVLNIANHKGRFSGESNKPQSRSINDVLDFAVTGIKLWQNLTKR